MTTPDYKIGYKAVNRRRITGKSVLDKIRYRKLRVIGAGANGIVLTDGKYAIKVGSIYSGDYEWLNTAAKYGFAVPVVYCEYDIKIDSRIVNVIRNSNPKRNGEAVYIGDYISDEDYADIMVSLLAEPYLDNECNIPQGSEARAHAYHLVACVKDYVLKCGIEWGDAHPWNLGIYNGGIIIIDP